MSADPRVSLSRPAWAVSVVSHGHGGLLPELLGHLCAAAAGSPIRVWVTLNVPEQPAGLATRWPGLDIRVLHNPSPAGFGANHNRAFAQEHKQADAAPWFVVMNPDVAWSANPFPGMCLAATRAARDGGNPVGLVYTRQVDADGNAQDHARRLPTPWSLWQRHGWPRSGHGPCSRPDWVNAAFVMLPSPVFAQVGGFDERYRMYCEDVDLCLRLQLAGHRLVLADDVTVLHQASRASRRDPRHLWWHVQSLVRLWCSPAYGRYRQFNASQGG